MYYFKINEDFVIKIPARNYEQAMVRLHSLLLQQSEEKTTVGQVTPTTFEGLPSIHEILETEVKSHEYIGTEYKGTVYKDFSLPQGQWYSKINWVKLREQKEALDTLTRETTLDNSLEENQEKLEGVIRLITHIQDWVVDVEGVDENTVFDLTYEENE